MAPHEPAPLHSPERGHGTSPSTRPRGVAASRSGSARDELVRVPVLGPGERRPTARGKRLAERTAARRTPAPGRTAAARAGPPLGPGCARWRGPWRAPRWNPPRWDRRRTSARTSRGPPERRPHILPRSPVRRHCAPHRAPPPPRPAWREVARPVRPGRRCTGPTGPCPRVPCGPVCSARPFRRRPSAAPAPAPPPPRSTARTLRPPRSSRR